MGSNSYWNITDKVEKKNVYNDNIFNEKGLVMNWSLFTSYQQLICGSTY
jgi:hypothetical protein